MSSPLRQSGLDRAIDAFCDGRRVVHAPRLPPGTDEPDNLDLLASFKVGALRQLRWLRALREEDLERSGRSITNNLSTKSDHPYPRASLRSRGARRARPARYAVGSADHGYKVLVSDRITG
jgi:hypothetical protein